MKRRTSADSPVVPKEAYPPAEYPPAPEPRRTGRPSLYHTGYDAMVYNLRLLGATDYRIALALSIELKVFRSWLARNPSLRQAYENGGLNADAFVARSWYRRATGYSHEAEKLFYNAKADKVVRAKFTEHYAPDTGAFINWLANRQPELWKTSRTANEVSGPGGQPLLPPVVVVEPVWRTIEGQAEPATSIAQDAAP